MEILTRSASVRDRVATWKKAGQRVALVPTSGSLHKGHLRLIAEAQERADRVIVSVFADTDAQPPLVGADREFLQNIAPDVLFVPPMQELFPFGRDFSVRVSLPSLAQALRGIASAEALSQTITVVAKLLHVVQPDCVVLGERHYSVLVMVRRMVEDLFMQIDVVECATFRDSDGLALATVNRDLSPDDRVVACNLHATLWRIAERLNGGERDIPALIDQATAVLHSSGLTVDYLHILDAHDLGPVRAASRDLVILGAARVHQIELTDALRVRVVDRY